MVANPKWCSVPLSEVRERGLRLEAAVYDVESRAARESVVNGRFGWKPLAGKDGFAENTFYPGRFKRVYCPSGHGIPFFLPSQLMEVNPVPEKFISAVTDCPIDALRLKEGTIALARSGSIGPISFVSKTMAGKVFSDDVIRMSFRFSDDAGYVYAFLKSHAGQLLLCGSQYGAVITHIEPEHLDSIPVPDAPPATKTRIHEAIAKSYALRDESNDLLHKATALLQEALDLPSIVDIDGSSSPRAEKPRTFDVRLRDLAGRLDGSYHVPVVRTIEMRLASSGSEIATVGDPRVSKQIILPGRFKRVYVEEGYGKVFIGGKQLGELDPSNKKYLSVAHHGKQIERQLTLRKNMTLVTCSGTIGRVALVGRHWDGWTASQHILRVVPASDDIAGYLYVWLSSEWAKPLILRHSYGAVIDEIDDSQLSSVPVPLLPDPATLAGINRLALTASALRTEAYDLEQSALRDMETNVLGTP